MYDSFNRSDIIVTWPFPDDGGYPIENFTIGFSEDLKAWENITVDGNTTSYHYYNIFRILGYFHDTIADMRSQI